MLVTSKAEKGSNYYIAGDWGTTHLRLALVQKDDGICIMEKRGPGIGQIRPSEIPHVFGALVHDWIANHAVTDAVLCGMAGSNIGWLDAGYVPCPAHIDEIRNRFARTRYENVSVSIVPGLKCVNLAGAPDVMRGEETQLLGALQRKPVLGQGQHLICMPGTHTKWTLFADGVAETFLTSVSGELFAALAEHSVLVKAGTPSVQVDWAFELGLERALALPDADLQHLIFETRSRQIADGIDNGEARSFLSGVLIGRDVMSAWRLFEKEIGSPMITIIGNRSLGHLYRMACGKLQVQCETLDGHQLSLAGIHCLAEREIVHG
ncbi:2-dehydro-3-deoxygalactonokinase [Kordiimonas sp.]|uniref:2-dehydro-3-deoxygalactonokinase n=1 Tax=Kordiimonas sp. TaxID=1970157 RepID=UPI003A8E2A25